MGPDFSAWPEMQDVWAPNNLDLENEDSLRPADDDSHDAPEWLAQQHFDDWSHLQLNVDAGNYGLDETDRSSEPLAEIGTQVPPH